LSKEILEQRRAKLETLREKGVEPYGRPFKPTHGSAEILEGASELEQAGTKVSVAGRLMSRRGHGKAAFGHIQDRSGRIQVYFKQDLLGEEAYAVCKLLDVGDILGVEGMVFRTRTGEITVSAAAVNLLAKALRPLPEKWHGLRDVEIRARQRYLDLIANEEARAVAIKRSLVTSSIRTFLDGEGYLEVETPVLQPIYGGAFASPFETFHSTLDEKLYLRIADELYLKRLIVGGLEKVYEIGKDFRNEGMDRLHNPEFTQVEFYEAYADYGRMMEVVENLVSFVAAAVTGGRTTAYGDRTIDFAPPWKRVKILDCVSEACGTDVSRAGPEDLKDICKSRGVEFKEPVGWAKLIEVLFDALVQDTLVQPTFVMDYPRELSPLAKTKTDDPRLVERFEAFAGGLELGNAFSEQNDPEEQLKAFERQGELRRLGDMEAQVTDTDYVTALEYGMPPTGGVGMGIDRLVMLITGATNIREVILFPHMRKAAPDGETEAEEGDGDC
jgi:lysyl-tRNA synthetase class 2